jgi:hypothetical protein
MSHRSFSSWRRAVAACAATAAFGLLGMAPTRVWTRHALNAGDTVTVICAPLRGTPHGAWAVNVLDASGKKLFVDSPAGTSQ